MKKDTLFYFQGSPFARMARVLVLEWSLPITCRELPFPPPEDLFDINPLGQVPVLSLSDGRNLAPTLIVLEHLASVAGHEDATDRQQLLTILLAGDALTSALYQDWSGLRPSARNAVGYDPAERNIERFNRVLDWADRRIEIGEFEGGISLPGIALACLLLWSDARGGPAWRRRKNLVALVDDLALRPSFVATAPQPWSP